MISAHQSFVEFFPTLALAQTLYSHPRYSVGLEAPRKSSARSRGKSPWSEAKQWAIAFILSSSFKSTVGATPPCRNNHLLPPVSIQAATELSANGDFWSGFKRAKRLF